VRRLVAAALYPTGGDEAGVDGVTELGDHHQVVRFNGGRLPVVVAERFEVSEAPAVDLLDASHPPKVLVAAVGRSPRRQDPDLVASSNRPAR